MTNRPAHLPDYREPPVTEVVLGIQFTPLTAFRIVDYGPVRQLFRGAFPKLTEQPPLDPIFETFAPNLGSQPLVQFLRLPPKPRVWFSDEADVQLVQFQPDRFIHNWRKTSVNTQYPRYENIRQRYWEELELLSRYLDSDNLGSIEPNQCEITYVNQIVSSSTENLIGRFESVFRGWHFMGKPGQLPQYEDARFTIRFVLKSAEGDPIGRLIATAEPGRSEDGRAIVQFTLTARGKPSVPTIQSAIDFLDLGRERIVQSFTDLTTDAMHQQWGRQK